LREEIYLTMTRGHFLMSRQFSLATVFRMTTNELLQEFFEKLGNPCWSMDWRHRPRRNVTSTLQCLTYFEPAQRQQAELILRQVFELACPTGFEMLRSAANDSSRKQVLQQVPDGWNLYCKALWYWLKAPRVFEQAYLLHEVENLSWWRK